MPLELRHKLGNRAGLVPGKRGEVIVQTFGQ
jgi:hypothetical protein